MTAAQKRALAWLPADGSWRTKPGRLTAALVSLKMRLPIGSVEDGWAEYGPRGELILRWRLTGIGINHVMKEKL